MAYVNTAGCDAIPARLLKPVAANLSQHITCIFNQSIDNCVFPWDAKLADVVPLFKKGDNLVTKNSAEHTCSLFVTFQLIFDMKVQ